MTLRCLLVGHAFGAPFLARPEVIAVKCAECGKVSPGVWVGIPKPSASVVSIETWRQKGEHRAA